MAGLVRKSFGSPEEVRPFEAGKGRLELVNMDAGPVGRATFEPGWRWSGHVKPIAGTDSCRASHVGYSYRAVSRSSWTTVRKRSSAPGTT